MPQFFIADESVNDGLITIRGKDLHHLINVRRVRINDVISLRSRGGSGYKTKIISIRPDSIITEIIDETSSGDIPVDISLYLSLLKPAKFEYAIQKAIEIGVSRITPVITERSITVAGMNMDSKLVRWSKIAEESAKQCMRNNIPEIGGIASFRDIIQNKISCIKLLAHPGAVKDISEKITELDECRPVSILIGPEGGFSESEVSDASASGWEPVSFGFTCLRAETAAVIIPSLVIYEWGRVSPETSER